jgi:hypothetical protein
MVTLIPFAFFVECLTGAEANRDRPAPRPCVIVVARACRLMVQRIIAANGDYVVTESPVIVPAIMTPAAAIRGAWASLIAVKSSMPIYS